MKGETFDYGKKMMEGKKVLTLFTSGGVYSDSVFNFDYPNWNSITLITKANFTFMGFDASEIINSSLRDETTEVAKLNEAKTKIQEVVKRWYA
jgi:FMN-dependent NADH-azoreductase